MHRGQQDDQLYVGRNDPPSMGIASRATEVATLAAPAAIATSPADTMPNQSIRPESARRCSAAGCSVKAHGLAKTARFGEIYPEMISAAQAASDHAAIWSDVDV
jgi:hypothetical protein